MRGGTDMYCQSCARVPTVGVGSRGLTSPALHAYHQSHCTRVQFNSPMKQQKVIVACSCPTAARATRVVVQQIGPIHILCILCMYELLECPDSVTGVIEINGTGKQ